MGSEIISRDYMLYVFLKSGVTVGDLPDQIGHTSLATMGIYLKVGPNHRREAYMRSKLSNLLEGENPKNPGIEHRF